MATGRDGIGKRREDPRDGPVPLSSTNTNKDKDQGAQRDGSVPLSRTNTTKDMDQSIPREGTVTTNQRRAHCNTTLQGPTKDTRGLPTIKPPSTGRKRVRAPTGEVATFPKDPGDQDTQPLQGPTGRPRMKKRRIQDYFGQHQASQAGNKPAPQATPHLYQTPSSAAIPPAPQDSVPAPQCLQGGPSRPAPQPTEPTGPARDGRADPEDNPQQSNCRPPRPGAFTRRT